VVSDESYFTEALTALYDKIGGSDRYRRRAIL
jgi:hypothetical protein